MDDEREQELGQEICLAWRILNCPSIAPHPCELKGCEPCRELDRERCTDR